MTTGSRTARLTRKGALTRGRIVDTAADLIQQRSVAGTTIDDVRAAAQVSGSQLYHYFADKDELVEAVIDRQTEAIVTTTAEADLGTLDGLRAWRDLVVDHARQVAGKGGCPLGSLGGQLAETDERARVRIADGFTRWSEALRDGLTRLHDDGRLIAGIDPSRFAVTLLATLQGGLLLAQVERETHSLETSLDTLLGLGVIGWVDAGLPVTAG